MPAPKWASIRWGSVAMTANAKASVRDEDLAAAICQHVHQVSVGVTDRHQAELKLPILDGCRVLSLHRTGNGTAFWIIMEPDQTLTVLLSNEAFQDLRIPHQSDKAW